MNMEFYNKIAKSTAHRKSRDENKGFIFENPFLMPDLVEIAFDVNDKNHHKACWILELICEEQIDLFLPFVIVFCGKIKFFKSAKR